MPARYARIVEKLLPGWEISLAFVDTRTARALNRRLRGKSYTPNVLSYKVGHKHGEIIMCRDAARTQAPSYNLSPTTFYLFLFIHALLHLKGGLHGATMERRESRLLAQFTKKSVAQVSSPSLPHGTTHSHRHRHRHLSGETRRRRRNER